MTKKLKSDIQRIVEIIKKKYQPEKIILFGDFFIMVLRFGLKMGVYKKEEFLSNWKIKE